MCGYTSCSSSQNVQLSDIYFLSCFPSFWSSPQCQIDKEKQFVLGAHQEQIDRLFAADTMEEICEALANDASDWATKQLEVLKG